jgi:hypothetical protein
MVTENVNSSQVTSLPPARWRTHLFISRRKIRILHLIHLRYVPWGGVLCKTGVAVAKQFLCDKYPPLHPIIDRQIGS